MSIIVIKNIIVSPNNLHIVKYYFFGLVKINWQFEKTDFLQLKSYGSDFGAEGEYVDTDPTGTGLGCLFGIFAVFTKSEIIHKEIIIEKLSSMETVVKRVYIDVDRGEYKILQRFVD